VAVGRALAAQAEHRKGPGLAGRSGEQTPAAGLGAFEHGVLRTVGARLPFANIHPGEAARAVLVPLFADKTPAWRDLRPGDELRMYEGARICGRGIVSWVEPANWQMPEDQRERFTAWLKDPAQQQ
jgi:hypothetical protein